MFSAVWVMSGRPAAHLAATGRLEPEASTSVLVSAALAGDQEAWRRIVARYERLVWKAVTMVASGEQDREDAYSRTWLRLSESLGAVRDPERLAGWLSVTATREAIAVCRSARAVPLDGFELGDRMERRNDRMAAVEGEPESEALRGELRAAARAGFAQLDELCRELLTLLVLSDPPMSYAEVERTMQRPHGWIGPTRTRCLDKLRRTPALRQVLADSPTDGEG